MRANRVASRDPSPVGRPVSLGNAFRAVYATGDADLQPETATTYSIGAAVDAGLFKGAIDCSRRLDRPGCRAARPARPGWGLRLDRAVQFQ